MKILFFTPRLPYPPHRGDKIKIFNILKRMAIRHDIHLVSLLDNSTEQEYLPYLAPFCSKIFTIINPRINSLINASKSLLIGEPLQVGYFKSKKMLQLMKELLNNPYDIAYIHLIRSAPYFLLTTEIKFPLILDQTDAMTLYWQRRARQKSFLSAQKYMYLLESQLIKQYEAKNIPFFHKCLTCSYRDLQVLKNLAPNASYEVLPNGLDLESMPFANLQEYKKNRIIYLGYMGYAPNLDGALYFYNKIYPLVKQSIKNVELFIVGKDPPRQVRKLASNDKSVTVTGYVENIWPYLAKAAVMVNPIRFGAGTQNKVLEAMAVGTPVVTSPISAEGLEVESGKELLVARDPLDFSRKIISLMQDISLREQIRINARKYVIKKHNWDKIIDQLENIFYQVINEFKR